MNKLPIQLNILFGRNKDKILALEADIEKYFNVFKKGKNESKDNSKSKSEQRHSQLRISKYKTVEFPF